MQSVQNQFPVGRLLYHSFKQSQRDVGSCVNRAETSVLKPKVSTEKKTRGQVLPQSPAQRGRGTTSGHREIALSTPAGKLLFNTPFFFRLSHLHIISKFRKLYVTPAVKSEHKVLLF